MDGRARWPWRAVLAIATIALTGCGDGSGPQEPDTDGWTVIQGSPDSGQGARHDDVFFLDPNQGWLINGRGETYRSTDAGRTWTQISKVNVFLRTVGFASPQLGWVGNYNFTNTPVPDMALWETRDGGVTWNNISLRIRGPAVAGLCGLQVINATTVVAVGRWNGPPVFVKSTDAGQSWTSLDFRPLATGMVDVRFLDERLGFVVGGLGVGTPDADQRASRTVVLRTVDGGATWQTVYASTQTGQWAWKIHFVDRQTGYVTTEGPTPQGFILKTVDGGNTWTERMVESGQSFEGVAFITPLKGWIGSFDGLRATDDGGVTWRKLDIGPATNRMRVLSDGRVVGCGQQIYQHSP